mmetsp:Transcript_5253/g.11680  ORF Transcript_5253/g.11680 Transcript_5253/m.11680 type:complete len:86 (-) Transcript_5253:2145-2402(-)
MYVLLVKTYTYRQSATLLSCNRDAYYDGVVIAQSLVDKVLVSLPQVTQHTIFTSCGFDCPVFASPSTAAQHVKEGRRIKRGCYRF